MSRFLSELELPSRLEIEHRAGCHQLADARGTLFDENFYCFRIAESRAGSESVEAVKLGRISGAERGGDPSLGVGSCAVEQRPLRQYGDVTVTGAAPRRMEPCDTASND
jgi:hypothetical protein